MVRSPFRTDLQYLTEGGQETELMYGHGFTLPHFALFPLLDDPAAVGQLTAMYTAVLEVAARHGMGVLLGGLDYRASPDWAALLGLSTSALAEYQRRSIEFLRAMAEPYRERVPHVLVSGIVGPQGDAYERNETITREAAERYHSAQMANLAAARVDVAQAMTFTSAEEAIGVARAARTHELPVIISFMPEADEGAVGVSELIGQVERATDSYPVCYGVNCSHPTEFEPMLRQGCDWVNRIGMLRPNASAKEKVELCEIGHLERGDPVALAEDMRRVAESMPYVRVWGGCCGTWDEHLELIACAVAPRPIGAPAA